MYADEREFCEFDSKKCTITNAAKRFAQLTMLGDDDV